MGQLLTILIIPPLVGVDHLRCLSIYLGER